MSDSPTPIEDPKEGERSPSDEHIQLIGELLAAAADMLRGLEFARLGGPGLFRKWLSIIVTSLAMIRSRALCLRAKNLRWMADGLFRHTSVLFTYRPPQNWVAP